MSGDPPEGLLLVDKPAGWTSHDVVARVRRLAGTRRVGHAGTLDPMATGLLLLGLGRATRLLGHLSLADKDYLAGIRLGVATSTDDAEGEPVARSAQPWTEDAVRAAMARLTGRIEQIPPAFSAIKTAGQRSYARARAGEQVHLEPRPVTVHRFELVAVSGDLLSAEVSCSSGTYVRALARDLGRELGGHAHLASLRRTRIGGYRLDDAAGLPVLEGLAPDRLPVLPLSAAVSAGFPRRELDAAAAADLRHGRPVPPTGAPGTHGAFGPDGALLALIADRGGAARPVVVFAPA